MLAHGLAIGLERVEPTLPGRHLRGGKVVRQQIAIEPAAANGTGEQGRDVFAVPGSPLDPRCEGSNKLIRDGAILLMSSRDVLEALASEPEPRQMQFLEPDSDPIEPRDLKDSDRDRLLELLSPTPVDTDDLIRESRLDPGAVSALILELSLAGKIIRYPNGAVSLA